MWSSLRQAYDLVGRDRPWRWAALVVLALMISGIEMVGAVLVFVLLSLVADPGQPIELPLLGDPRQYAADVPETTLLLMLVAIMGAFFLFRAGLRIAAVYAQSRVAANAGARLSRRLVEGYLRWPYALHLQRSSADLIRNGHQAVIELVGQVVNPTIKIVAESVLVLGLLTILAVIAPGATALAVVVVGGAAVVLLAVVQPRLKRLGRIRHEEARATLGSLQQSLHGIRDVKVLGRERYFASVYGASRRRMARAGYLNSTVSQLPSIVMETALVGFILLAFALTILQGGAASETLSVLGLFAYAGLRLQPSLQHIVGGLNSLRFSAAPLQDLHRDLRTIERLPPVERRASPLPFRDRLEFVDVHFRYHGAAADALRGIDLTIRPGEQIGICGPTGGGKTTLMDVLAGLLSPTRGRVLIDGLDLQDHERAWQATLGIVPQMVFLLDDTLRRNIAFGVPDDQIDDEAVTEAVHLAQLEAFIAELPDGLETTVGERGVRVSGGQRQRVAIARALYHRPAVLVFDEGTSALDNATEALLMEAIERLRGDHTILLVAHRLSTVRHSDRVLYLEHGRIEAQGTFEELQRSSSRFRELTIPG